MPSDPRNLEPRARALAAQLRSFDPKAPSLCLKCFAAFVHELHAAAYEHLGVKVPELYDGLMRFVAADHTLVRDERISISVALLLHQSTECPRCSIQMQELSYREIQFDGLCDISCRLLTVYLSLPYWSTQKKPFRSGRWPSSPSALLPLGADNTIGRLVRSASVSCSGPVALLGALLQRYRQPVFEAIMNPSHENWLLKCVISAFQEAGKRATEALATHNESVKSSGSSTSSSQGDLAVRQSLMDLSIAQYECHSDDTLAELKTALSNFHALKDVFRKHGVRADFKLPKLHMLQHYVESVRLFGATDNYNTEATERLHIDLAKHAFRATNKRNFVTQMCRWLERREAVFWFATHLAWTCGETFDARRKKVASTHAPVNLAKRPHRLRVFLPTLRDEFGAKDIRPALEDFLRSWHHLPTHRGYATLLPPRVAAALDALPSVRLWNHVKFYTPNVQTKAAADILNIAYASASRGRFDTVLINTKRAEVAGKGGLDGIRVARLRAIFKVPEAFEQALFGRARPGHLAYVEWFTPLPSTRNDVNGMFHIRNERADGRRRASVIEVVNIRRACQLFPKFGSAAVDRALTSNTILDGFSEFYLNNRADKDMYRTTHVEASDSDDDTE